MQLSKEEIEEAMEMAIQVGIATGNIDPIRYLTTKKLTELETYFIAPEFYWQAAGIMGRKEIKRIMEKKDDETET